MLSDRVKETTATTGTGSLTLAGAVTNFRTFTSGFLNDQTINYAIESGTAWEIGIGHLSSSTVLVRDYALSNSAGTTAKISITGTSTVFCSMSEGQGGSSMQGVTDGFFSNPFVQAANITTTQTTSETITANRVYYLAFKLEVDGLFDAFAVDIRTAAGTGANKIHFALYDRGPHGGPGKRVISAEDMDPSVTGTIVSTFTETRLKAGWYWVSMWSDVGPQFSAPQNGTDCLPTNFGVNSNGNQITHCYVGASSLSILADPATAPTNESTSARTPFIWLRATT